MVEDYIRKNEDVEGDDNLVMFYGMLNLPMLAQILPFDAEHRTKVERINHLKTKSTALVCDGWSRVFGCNHATIEKDENG